MRCRCLCLLLAFSLPACAAHPGSDPATHTGGPATEDEKIVAERILKGVDNPDSVEWLEWGPHDLTGETHFRNPAGYKLLRVRWRWQPREGPRTTNDGIYRIEPGLRYAPVPRPNFEGRRWIESAKALKRQQERAAEEHGGPSQ